MVHETDLDETTANAGTLALILLSFFFATSVIKYGKGVERHHTSEIS